MVGYTRLIIAFLILPLVSFAEESCPANLLVVDKVVDWDFTNGSRSDFYLPSYFTQQGMVRTDAAGHFSSSGNIMSAYFDFASRLIWPNYNIYRYDVEVGTPGSADYFQKTAGDCNGEPASMGVGQNLKGYPIQIPPHANGEARTHEPVRIRVWGHMN